LLLMIESEKPFLLMIFNNGYFGAHLIKVLLRAPFHTVPFPNPKGL